MQRITSRVTWCTNTQRWALHQNFVMYWFDVNF
jgi:hypothetical protein